MAQSELISQVTGGLDPFDAPIPGESLTASKEAPLPFETPPEMNSPEEVIQDMWNKVSSDESLLDKLLDSMRDGVPLEDTAQILLFGAFQSGKINPDVMLLSIEPTIYFLAFLANHAEIAAVIYPEEDFDEEAEADADEAMSRITRSMEEAGNLPQEITIGGQTLQRPKAIPESLLQEARQPSQEMPMSEEEMMNV